ncbi:transcriptional regulator [Pseudomonas sp. MC042]|uniref:Transcriptional regulator n=1 Tax=Pseudomonas piscis TaxID=2614538 RepID=A0A7X1PJ27_9PSED|nr:transcriptional regulator [Pseudomonas piscis]POA54626.1 transcriptional regulator [Pseudomonas sp. FW507-12TSA]
MLAAYGLHTDLGHLLPLLRPAGRRMTAVGLRASLFCFD